MTGHTGNISMEELGRRRFFRLNQLIQEQATNIVKEKAGKGPFELTVFGSAGVIIFNTNVKDHNGDFTWTRGTELQRELEAPVAEVVTMKWESQDDSRVYEFESINLDEVKDATGSGAPPAGEVRKPATAGATD